jgi:hypothetical protein
MTDQSRLTWALILSVLLHGLVLTLLPLVRHARMEIPTPALIDVDLMQLPKLRPQSPSAAAPAPQAPPAPALPIPKQQIVSPSEQGEEKEPANTRLLSDRNNTVKEETVHRGEPAAGNPEAKAPAPQHPPANGQAERQELKRKAQPQHDGSHTQVAALPKLDQLLPQPGDLIREGLAQPERQAAAPPAQQQASTQHPDLLRHGEALRSGGLHSGSLDYLPGVRESDLTLLNTKAERFAPFVRRVAIRVFQHLEIALKQAFGGGAVGSGREYAIVEALMSKDGQMLSVRLVERQSDTSLAAYRVLLDATRPETFFDANPPPGAEGNDGKIHFVMLVDLAVQGAPDPRAGSRGGYYGIAGVGLDAAPQRN